MRVNTTLLAICIVDALKLYKGSMGNRAAISPNDFYCELADGLNGNNLDSLNLRQRFTP